MTNWQSAINNASFAFEYKESLRPGENDVSFQLIMADQRNQYIANKKMTAEKTADTNSLWKDITDVAGHILTPGTMIADELRKNMGKADTGMAIFTGTVADVVEEFLNTLVSQLIKNLQAGFFSSAPVDNSGTLDLKPLLALFNPNSSPISIINGTAGAKAKFGGLLSSDNYKVGGKYDLLVKLATCSDDAKNNPGPTDCVLDQGLVSAIKSMSYVNDLPQDIKNRVFAPSSEMEKTLTSNMISYRSILIMRSYRIVPVGWEVAAEIAHNNNATQITLGEVMERFNIDDRLTNPKSYYHLVDPYWTLKLPELYCRRTGYGEQNSGIKDQSLTINRNEYCSDPTQCLKEDGSGKCLSYGYCEEEKPIWRLGKECEPRYNTCTTYTSRSNAEANWLANTLDYGNCNANNVGCRSYATNYNYQSKMWNGDKIIDSAVTRLSSNLLENTISVDTSDSRWHVLEGHSISINSRLDLGTVCNKGNCAKITGCVWDETDKNCIMAGANNSCVVPPGGISCAVESCFSATNALSGLNPGFEEQETGLNTGNAKFWTDELSFSDINNRHYRAAGAGVSGYGLKAVSANNSVDLITSLPSASLPAIPLAAGKTYKLKFSIRGTITNGSIRVGIRDGNDPYAEGADNTNVGWSFVSSIANWTTIELPFVNDKNFTEGRVVIITPVDSITDVAFDNFSLQQMTDSCSAGSVRLFTAPTDESNYLSASNLYLDRDAEICGASSAGCSQFIRVHSNRIASEFSEAQIPALDYASKEYAYLKKAPDYYSCYKNQGGAWPSTAFELNNVIAKQAPECNSFAKVCMKSEVGCELYTPVNGDPQIPGIVDNLDLCPSECSGYQIYKQEATNFIANASYKQLIADKNAKYCSAAFAGCDEFTNLDELGRGAEKKEYYVSFKACQRPQADDANYYTWEGSDTTGYQLKSFVLKKSRVLDPQTNLGYAPCTDLTYPNADGANYCNDVLTDGFCTKSDMAVNSDCREFYDASGYVHYRLQSKTISVSDNCHPYRRTQTQTTVDAAQTDCVGSHGWWKTATNECIYMAIPQEGRTCSAAAAGCRAYTGNRGNNVRNILSASDFISDDLNSNFWVDLSLSKSGLKISSESTYPGGNSLSNNGQPYIMHPVSLVKNRTYTLSFWAKGDIAFNNLEVSFNAGVIANNLGTLMNKFSAASLAGENLLEPRIMVSTDWRRYDLGPVFVTGDPSGSEYLFFDTKGNKIYLDNIILKELSNNIYAIENSWYTPVSCDNKLDDSSGAASVKANTCVNPISIEAGKESGRCSPGEMLGCTAYKDRASTLWYLRSFNALCRKEAAGCEALIDTHNSDSKDAESFNIETPNYDDVTVPADNLVYLVNDQKTSCASADKGCTALGLPIIDKWDAVVGYQTVYKKNNPTRYNTDLCKHSELWCEEYAGNNSFNYFKDPHGKNCEYNSASSIWFKIGTDQPCDTTLSQTYGTGDVEAKRQPIGSSEIGLDMTGCYNPDTGERLSGVSQADCVTTATGACYSGYAGYPGSIPMTAYTTRTECYHFVNYFCLDLANQHYYPYNDDDPDCSAIPEHSCINQDNTTNCMRHANFSESACTACHGTWSTPGSWSNPIRISENFEEPRHWEITYTHREWTTFIPKDSNYSGWAGNCSADQATCSEYVDPLPYMYSSIQAAGGLKANSLYAFEASAVLSPVSISSSDSDCHVEIKSESTFYLSSDSLINCSVAATNVKKITQAGVYYALQSSVNYSSCNGQVDYRNGCVLFNDRSQRNLAAIASSEQNKYLNYNALQTYADNMTNSVIGGPFSNNAKPVPPAIASGAQADTSKIIKVKADRQCNKWLYCNSYAKKDPASTVAKYEEGDRCFGLGTCSAFDGNGNCSNVVAEDMNVRADYLYEVDKNKTGYAKIGFKPYSVMDQAGGSAPFANGNFEYTFGDKGEPLGWRLANSVTSWEPFMYEIKNDPANAPEGSSYLALKGKHDSTLGDGLLSEEIDVIVGTPYYISYWVDTTGIADRGDVAYLRLLDGEDFDSKTGSTKYDPLVVRSVNGGQVWQKVTITFTPSVSKIYVQIGNYIPNNETGQSLWDDIQIKPLLNANASTDIARSCRAYPETSSRSCQYSGTDKFYYGQYGYCMLQDPKNKKQCLQWWPVDEIKGELVEQFSGYQDMRPLYYCVESQPIKIKLTNLSNDTRVDTNNLSDKYKSLADLDTGKAMRFVPFTSQQIPDAYRALFRFPYIGKFDFKGLIVAVGGINSGNTTGIGLPLIAKMYKDAVMINGFPIRPDKNNNNYTGCNSLITADTPEARRSQALQFMINGSGDSYCSNFFASDSKNKSCGSNTGCRIFDYNPGVNGVRAYLNVAGHGNFGETSQCCEGYDLLTDSTGTYCNIPDTNKPFLGHANGPEDPDCQMLLGCRVGMVAIKKALVTDLNNGNLSVNTTNCASECKNIIGELIDNTNHSENNWSYGGFDQVTTKDLLDILGKNTSNDLLFWNGFAVSDSTAGSEYDACVRVCNADFENLYNYNVLPILEYNFQIQSGESTGIVTKIFGFLSGFGAIIKGMLSGNNEPKFIPDKDTWGGFGVEGFHVDKLPIVYVLPWHLTMANTEGLSSLATFIYTLAGTVLKIIGVKLPDFGMGNGGIRVITDQDVSFGGSNDPVPGLPGDILGFVHYLDYQGTFINGLNMTGVLSGEFTVNYCSKFVKVVTAVGTNKAWLDRVSPNSKYELFERVGGKDIKFNYFAPFNFTDFANTVSKCAGVMNDNPLSAAGAYNASDWKPFGAIVAPANSTNEVTWDSKPDVSYRQPLLLEPPLTNLSEPYQPRAGSIHNVGDLKKLFLKSYGAWQWQDNGIAISKMSAADVIQCIADAAGCGAQITNCLLGDKDLNQCRNTLSGTCQAFVSKCFSPDDASTDTYMESTDATLNWDVINEWDKGIWTEAGANNYGYCSGARGSNKCRLRPEFSEVNAVPTDNNPTLIGLSFNVQIDANQLPITSYTINWGDSVDTVTGVSLKQRIDPNNPFKFYHNYDFAKLKLNDPISNDITCGTSVEQCQVKIRINVKDNWNAQQEGIAMVMVRKE